MLLRSPDVGTQLTDYNGRAPNPWLCSRPGRIASGLGDLPQAVFASGLLQAMTWLSRVLLQPADPHDVALLMPPSAGGPHSCQMEIFSELCCSLRYSLANPPPSSFSFIRASPSWCCKDCPTSGGSLLFLSRRYWAQCVFCMCHSVLLSTSQRIWMNMPGFPTLPMKLWVLMSIYYLWSIFHILNVLKAWMEKGEEE